MGDKLTVSTEKHGPLYDFPLSQLRKNSYLKSFQSELGDNVPEVPLFIVSLAVPRAPGPVLFNMKSDIFTSSPPVLLLDSPNRSSIPEKKVRDFK